MINGLVLSTLNFGKGNMMKKYKGKRYYRIRAAVFWPTVGLFILLLLGGGILRMNYMRNGFGVEEWKMLHSRA